MSEFQKQKEIFKEKAQANVSVKKGSALAYNNKYKRLIIGSQQNINIPVDSVLT